MDAPFTCEKQSATGSRGMVVTNHPLASTAGMQMLVEGGNAIDAAIAALFALTVVEPMMVGVLGGGLAHLRLPDGRHTIIDGMSTAPAAARPDMFDAGSAVAARANVVGPLAMARAQFAAGVVHDAGALRHHAARRRAGPGAAAGGARLRRHAVPRPTAIADAAEDLQPVSRPLLPAAARRRTAAAGRANCAGRSTPTALRQIAAEGAAALYRGSLGTALAAPHAQSHGGVMTRADLAAVRVIEREPVHGAYRGWSVFGPPPPSSAGVHITQMLNILEGYDLAAMGFGSPDATHLLAEVLKIAFADRAVATADPAFVDVPVDHLTSKAYAAERRAKLWSMHRAQAMGGRALDGTGIGQHHACDGGGCRCGAVVSTTQTINGLWGARFAVPGTGLIANNYMFNFDPVHRRRALSVQPGEARVHLDGAHHGAAGRPDPVRPRVARWVAHLRVGHAGAGEPARPRHDPTAGGGGAAGLDPGRATRDRSRPSRTRRKPAYAGAGA